MTEPSSSGTPSPRRCSARRARKSIFRAGGPPSLAIAATEDNYDLKNEDPPKLERAKAGGAASSAGGFAGRALGISLDNPRWSRIFAMTAGSSINAISFIRPRHLGHCRSRPARSNPSRPSGTLPCRKGKMMPSSPKATTLWA